MSAPATTAAPPLPEPQQTSVEPRRPVFLPGPSARATLRVLVGTALAIVPLKQVFVDTYWFGQSALMMAAVLVPAAALRWRRPPRVWHLLPGLVLALLLIVAIFLPTHAVGGLLPTGASWTDLTNLGHQLARTSTDETAPIRSTAAVRVFVCLGAIGLALLVDLIALRMRRPAVTGIGFLVILAIAAALPRHTVNPFAAAAAAVGYLLILSVHATDQLPAWGPLINSPGRSTFRGAGGGTSVPRITVVTVPLAILIAAVVPVPGTDSIANALRNNAGGVQVDAMASLQGELNTTGAADLFKVTLGRHDAEPYYFRENVLDTFTGSSWVTGAPGPSESALDQGVGSVPSVNTQTGTLNSIEATVTIQRLRGNAPTLEYPIGASGLPYGWSWDDAGQILTGPGVSSGENYILDVVQPDPSIAALRSVDTYAEGLDPSLSQYLDLPATGFPSSVKALANQLIQGAPSMYDAVVSISNYFTNPANGFTYSLATKAGDSDSALVNFLHTKTGYCQQYAAAMGVMLRAVGIPARVVVGFTHTQPSATGQFEVTSHDAHAWVEVYFEGIGWVPFDPTPLTGVDAARKVALPYAPVALPSSGVIPSDINPKIKKTSGAPSTAAAHTAAPLTTAAAPTSSGSSIWLVAALVVLGIAALLAIPALVRLSRRRARLLAGRHGHIEPLWHELADTCRDLGLGWSDARTPRQVASWLAGHSLDGEAAAALTELVERLEQQRYQPAGVQSAAGADGLLKQVRKGLLSTLGAGQRARVTLLPSSLRWGDRNLPTTGQHAANGQRTGAR